MSPTQVGDTALYSPTPQKKPRSQKGQSSPGMKRLDQAASMKKIKQQLAEAQAALAKEKELNEEGKQMRLESYAQAERARASEQASKVAAVTLREKSKDDEQVRKQLAIMLDAEQKARSEEVEKRKLASSMLTMEKKSAAAQRSRLQKAAERGAKSSAEDVRQAKAESELAHKTGSELVRKAEARAAEAEAAEEKQKAMPPPPPRPQPAPSPRSSGTPLGRVTGGPKRGRSQSLGSYQALQERSAKLSEMAEKGKRKAGDAGFGGRPRKRARPRGDEPEEEMKLTPFPEKHGRGHEVPGPEAAHPSLRPPQKAKAPEEPTVTQDFHVNSDESRPPTPRQRETNAVPPSDYPYALGKGMYRGALANERMHMHVADRMDTDDPLGDTDGGARLIGESVRHQRDPASWNAISDNRDISIRGTREAIAEALADPIAPNKRPETLPDFARDQELTVQQDKFQQIKQVRDVLGAEQRYAGRVSALPASAVTNNDPTNLSRADVWESAGETSIHDRHREVADMDERDASAYVDDEELIASRRRGLRQDRQEEQKLRGGVVRPPDRDTGKQTQDFQRDERELPNSNVVQNELRAYFPSAATTDFQLAPGDELIKKSNVSIFFDGYKPANWPLGNVSNALHVQNLINSGIRWKQPCQVLPMRMRGGTVDGCVTACGEFSIDTKTLNRVGKLDDLQILDLELPYLPKFPVSSCIMPPLVKLRDQILSKDTLFQFNPSALGVDVPQDGDPLSFNPRANDTWEPVLRVGGRSRAFQNVEAPADAYNVDTQPGFSAAPGWIYDNTKRDPRLYNLYASRRGWW